MAQDAFLEALAALEDTLADNQKRTTLINKRIAQLRRLRSKGTSYAESIASRDGPLIVQLLTESSKALDRSGANVRRAEARALYAEGLTMEQIAELFGVTRQRVSTLLRKPPE
jgi:DNA-directed RNA polymerase specialized sigma24 family protein